MALASAFVMATLVACAVTLRIHPYVRQNVHQLNTTWLLNSVRGARAVPAARHPWLGRLTAARGSPRPALCSAAALRPRVFVTTARCVVGLRPEIVHVYYKSTPLPVLAFVLSDARGLSPQLFDDLALVVTRSPHEPPRSTPEPPRSTPEPSWSAVRLRVLNRTDLDYEWFAALANEDGEMRHKIVAYSENKNNEEEVYELDVYFGINFCHQIYSLNYRYEGYRFPCAGPCRYQDYISNAKQCYNYISVGGAAVVDSSTGEVVAFSSWGDSADSPWHLPIGVTFPNTHEWEMNYKCAKEIARRQTIDEAVLKYCS